MGCRSGMYIGVWDVAVTALCICDGGGSGMYMGVWAVAVVVECTWECGIVVCIWECGMLYW